jgi:hypothetical protein
MDIYKCPNSIFKKESLKYKNPKNTIFFYGANVQFGITISVDNIYKNCLTA